MTSVITLSLKSCSGNSGKTRCNTQYGQDVHIVLETQAFGFLGTVALLLIKMCVNTLYLKKAIT